MTEDLSIFFEDFGVIAEHSSGIIKVLLDSKDSFISADVARFKDFEASCLKITKELPLLKVKDTLIVDGETFKVIEFERIDDGAFTRIYLTPAR